jgi:site-specific recombinase XerD
MSGDRRGLVPIQKPKPGAIAVVQPAVEAGKAFLSKNTIRAYTRDWLDFFKVERLDQVTVPMAMGVKPDHVADFRDECLAKGLGPGTVNRKLSSVRAFFDQLILRGLMSINPAHPKLVRPPKRGTVQKMEALSAAEAKSFLQAIDRTTKIGRRDYAVIMVDLHMGLRRSEALGIRAEQFRTVDGKACIVFRSKGEKERIIWVNRDLEEALAVYAKDRGDAPGWLFPGRNPKKHLSGDQFWRIVQSYLEKAGITKKVGTHGLRATFITHNLLKGTPIDQIQKTVGHARGETTLGYARDLEMIKSRAPEAMEGMNADGPREGK